VDNRKRNHVNKYLYNKSVIPFVLIGKQSGKAHRPVDGGLRIKTESCFILAHLSFWRSSGGIHMELSEVKSLLEESETKITSFRRSL